MCLIGLYWHVYAVGKQEKITGAAMHELLCADRSACCNIIPVLSSLPVRQLSFWCTVLFATAIVLCTAY